jgi:hypothetical protein
VSKYLHTGWHEFFVPVMTRHGRTHVRVWIEMEQVVPMLRELDRIYGDADHPYALRTEEIPDAQRKLLEMVIQHVLRHPGAVKRASASRQLAEELRERFGVQPSDYPIQYPPFIDQVDLDPGQVTFALPFILDRTRPAEP